MNSIIIKTENLTKIYNTGKIKTYALRGIDLEIPRGSFSCIIGPSGHGKSTLMHLIGGLDRLSKGRVFIDGTDITGLSNSELANLRASKIGFVFQFFNLLPNLTAEENVEVAMMFAETPEKIQKERAIQLLSLVGLEDKAKSKPSELSGGQQQRVAIARALANDPEILLMDEPTGNLDSDSEAEVLEVIFKLHRKGKTVVIVTHNHEIAKMAEIVFEIKDGKINTMEKLNEITRLLKEIEKISQIEKCLTCQCFYDTLMEFKEFLKKEKIDGDLETRLSRLIEKSKVTHDCLGCEPCLPVPVSNALTEITGTSHSCTCGPVCTPGIPPTLLHRERGAWPVEQGEYIIGNKTSSVAISTLGSDELPEVISRELGVDSFAIVGKTHTENIGIEKIIKNTITNPYIRFLILCGKDTRGHMAGQSLLSLFNRGINHEKRIIGSEGQRPVLKNLEFSEIEHWRLQVKVIDLVGTEDIKRIAEEVNTCREKNPGRFDSSLTPRKIPKIEAQRPGKLILDPSGFFIIYPNKDEGRIYLEHYNADGTLNEIIYGEDPVSIASTAIEHGLLSRLDHAAYLGRELEKAYLSMIYGFQYVQDSATSNS